MSHVTRQAVEMLNQLRCSDKICSFFSPHFIYDSAGAYIYNFFLNVLTLCDKFTWIQFTHVEHCLHIVSSTVITL